MKLTYHQKETLLSGIELKSYTIVFALDGCMTYKESTHAHIIYIHIWYTEEKYTIYFLDYTIVWNMSFFLPLRFNLLRRKRTGHPTLWLRARKRTSSQLSWKSSTQHAGPSRFRPGKKAQYSFSHNHGLVIVQWKMAWYLKGTDPIGDTPILH